MVILKKIFQQLTKLLSAMQCLPFWTTLCIAVQRITNAQFWLAHEHLATECPNLLQIFKFCMPVY